MKKLNIILLVLAVVSLLTGNAQAQVSAGAILGVVTDPSGAAIPGVTVTVTNEGTNQSRQVVTNETGSYRADSLQSGTYSITAELPGFRTEIRRGAVVNVDSRVRIDISLQVGQVSEVVEVSAESALVETDDSQIGQVMDQRKIVDLPLNGRNFSQLAYLTPGAFAPRPGSHLSDRGGFVAAGLEEKTNQLLVDGVNNNGAGTMEAAYRVNVDTVGEFKIQTQNYNAQYGRFAGAQVDAITKSGTNTFHGTMFAFTRNDNLDARNFFDPYPLTSKPEFKRHQYGGTLGGPILKDKAFFFFGFQGQRQTYYRRASPTVPQPAFWNGDLSLLNKTIRDPQNGQPFAGGRIPAGRLDPTALKFRSYYFVEPSTSNLARNASSLLSEPEHFWQPDVKINYNLNQNHQLIGSYGYYNSDLLEWRIAGSPELPNYHMFGKIKNQRISISEVWTVSSNVINELRGGLSRVYRIRLPYLRDKNYARDVFGIEGTVGDVDPIGYSVPQISISGYSTISPAGTQPRADGNWMITDTVSVQAGNHALKFGGDVFRQYMNLVVLSAQSGVFTFSGSYTGDAFADFLLGLPDTTQRALPLGPISMHPRRYSTNFFAQDDWKVRPNLTINYGLRYEVNFPLDEKWGRLSTFDPELANGKGGLRLVSGGERYKDTVRRFKEFYPTLEIKEEGGSLYKTDADNIAPRFGFAWTPFDQNATVVRGGWGIFYTIDDLCLCGHYNLAPFMLTQRFTRTQRPTFDNPWPAGTEAPISAIGVDKDFGSANYQHWNLGLQREIPGGIALDLTYTGKKGTHIDSERDINQPINGVRPYPLFGPIAYNESVGNSIYHGLQTRVEKRSSSGASVLIAYAWSKLIDDLGPFRDANNRRLERGLGTEDMRHRFSGSFVLPLPYGHNRRFGAAAPGILDAVFGGWDVTGIVRVNSGSPLTPTISIDNSGLGRRADRPDLVGDWRKDDPHPTQGWFNRNAFRMPAPGSYGNAGKGSLIGPGYVGTDFSLLKRIQLAENQDLQFRFEFFNAFNQANFFPVSGRFDAATFGTTGSALDNRQIQFGLKYLF